MLIAHPGRTSCGGCHLFHEWLQDTGLKSTDSGRTSASDAISATHARCPFGWVARLLCASVSLCRLRMTTAPASAGLSIQHPPQRMGQSQHSHVFRTARRAGLALVARALVTAIRLRETTSCPQQDGGRAGIQEARLPRPSLEGASHPAPAGLVTKLYAQCPPPKGCPMGPVPTTAQPGPGPPSLLPTQQRAKPTNPHLREPPPNLHPALRWHCPLWRLKLHGRAPGLGWAGWSLWS